MHAREILRDFLRGACTTMHQGRREALVSTVSSALGGSALTVTSLGRGLSKQGAEKHHIKRVDRLLSNPHLQVESTALYTALGRRLVAGTVRALISVDWSNLDRAKRNYLLRASVALDGRAMTLYEEVHPRDRFQKAKTERRFLRHLSEVLGPRVRPIIITDAGFHNPWFNAVLERGWDFIGRVRGRVMLATQCDDWVQAKRLFARASSRPQRLEYTQLSRHTPIACRFVLMKQSRRGRHQLNQDGQPARSENAKVQARARREPWLLATSLKLDERIAPRRIINAYRTRMQIEESFRDLKSVRFGLGFEASRAFTVERIAMLLLVALLATFIAWLLGACVEAAGQHRRYQANTVKSRRVLSRIYVGRRAVHDPSLDCCSNALDAAFALLCNLVQRNSQDL